MTALVVVLLVTAGMTVLIAAAGLRRRARRGHASEPPLARHRKRRDPYAPLHSDDRVDD